MTETATVESIIPYEFNNRTHPQEQIDRIAKSIEQFGFNQPIVIDESNVVLVGHGRLLAAQKLGLKEVPIVRKTKLSEVQKKAYRILDNKLQNDSTWVFDNLNLELGYLEDNDFDLPAWGLDELKDLLSPEEPEVTEDDFNPDDCENLETFIKRGDLIELGPHRVMCGDSVSREALEELFAGKLCQAVITDPPYGVSYTGGTTKREPLQGDESTELYGPTCMAAFRVSDQKASFYLFHAGITGNATATAAAAAAAAGYEIRNELIWNKNMAQFGALSAQYKQKHEPFFYCFKAGVAPRWYGPTNEVTVWDVDRAAKNEWHPTQKPVELIGRALKNSTVKGDLVGDLFLGSGTTLIAADQLDRICYGMEIEPKYCEVIIQRYKKECERVGKPFVCKVNGQPYNPVL